MSEKEKIVHVTTEHEYGGITATVTTDAGNVYTGRSHPSQGFLAPAEVSKERAITEATMKMNR